MVAKLSIPQFDSVEIIKTIITERVQHRDFFETMRNDWINTVLSYRENSGSPHIIQFLDLSKYISQERIDIEIEKSNTDINQQESLDRLVERRKKSLIGLYKPENNKMLYTILETMRDKHQLRFCPCCGEPGKPGTLDHYLPKSIYPEFSIVIENLTPMCTDCQEFKGNKVLDKHGNKVFLHPYFDLVELVFIELDIRPPFDNPSGFIASVPNTVPTDLKNLVERHLKDINFIARFEEFCSSEYSDLLTILSEEKTDPKRETVLKVVERFLKKAQQKDPNFWEAIFYRGILNNRHLLTLFLF